MTSISEQLHSSVGGRFAGVDVILPTSWRATECVTGRNVSESSLYAPGDEDSADFAVGSAHPLFGSSPVAGPQHGGCGVSARGAVTLPHAILTAGANVSQKDGE